MARRTKQGRLTAAELRSQIEQHIRNTDWWDNSEVQGNFEAALDCYNGRNEKADRPGFESMESEDVADMIEAITAEIMPAFRFDEVAIFEAHGRHDISQSRLESKVCNQMIFDFNNGDVEIQSAIKNLLLLRNGILKIYPDETVEREQERYRGLTDIEVFQAQQPTARNQEIDVTKLERAQDGEGFDLNLTRTTTRRRLTVESIDPVNFLIEKEFASIDPQGAVTVGERRIERRSDLISRGYNRKTVDKLNVMQVDTRQGSIARNRTGYTPTKQTTGDRSLDPIEVFELYLRMDYDGDGIAERRRIVYAGGTSGGQVLENELYPFVPYANGVAFLYPQRFQGISVYDKLKELARQKGRAFTQLIRNMINGNFPELIVEDGAIADTDIDERRSSGVIRADHTGAVAPIAVQDMVSNSLAFIQKLDEIRDERAGSAVTRQTSAPIGAETAYGADRQEGPRESMSVMICNTVGDTLVKQTFRLVHMNLRTYWGGEQDFHVGVDQFTTANPAEWPVRHKVRVTVGMSQSERDRVRAVLGEHLLQQEKLYEAGLDDELVSKDTYYDTLIAWSKAGGIHTPRRFWIDPSSEPARLAAQRKQVAAREAAQRQEAQTMALFRTQLLMQDVERRTDLFKHITGQRFDYWKETLGSELEEQRTEAQGSTSAAPDPDAIDRDQDIGRQRAGESEETPQ